MSYVCPICCLRQYKIEFEVLIYSEYRTFYLKKIKINPISYSKAK